MKAASNFSVVGKRVYENGNPLPTVVSPGHVVILQNAETFGRLEWEGYDALRRKEDGKWVIYEVEEVGEPKEVKTVETLVQAWLYVNNCE